MEKYNFQNCQKIVVFSKDGKEVLLCKRLGQADFDGTFSFIGGKMEVSDTSIIESLKREKNEEVGKNFKIKIFPTFSINLLYKKNDGDSMILPHYYAYYVEGDIELNEEYSQYQWVKIEDLESFSPKIPTIQGIVEKFLQFRGKIEEDCIII